MPEPAAPWVLILLSSTVGLLILLIGMMFGIFRRLGRIERSRNEGDPPREIDERSPLAAETSAGGAFEMFLDEDATRRNLPKGEQFAQYRKWRQEKGLNWSNS